jgi:hypothetical protein
MSIFHLRNQSEPQSENQTDKFFLEIINQLTEINASLRMIALEIDRSCVEKVSSSANQSVLKAAQTTV